MMPALRDRMGEAAIKIAQAVNYVGAGTVEFLFSDATRDFYFLEMNTRLQVEHPVTEMVTGLDLVREQITWRPGRALSFAQDDVQWRGHAIECRVYAEDPENNFLPSPGRIDFLRVPAGPGIRDDGGVTEGDEVSIYYDPMISKLAAWGRTREEAIDRLRRALDEYAVGGIKTRCLSFAKSCATKSLSRAVWTQDSSRVSTNAGTPASGMQRTSMRMQSGHRDHRGRAGVQTCSTTNSSRISN